MAKINLNNIVTINTCNASNAIKKSIQASCARENPNLDPAGFYWVENTLKHTGKKNLKAKKAAIKKSATMSDWEYVQFVAKQNKKFGDKLNTLDSNEDAWRELQIYNDNNKHNAEEFAEKFFMDKAGNIIVANINDGYKCDVKKPYFHSRTHMWHVTLTADEQINQSVRALLRRTWGEEYANDFIMLEKQMAKHM